MMTSQAYNDERSWSQFTKQATIQPLKKKVAAGHSKNARQASDDEPIKQGREKVEPIHKATNSSAIRKMVAAGHLQKILGKHMRK